MGFESKIAYGFTSLFLGGTPTDRLPVAYLANTADPLLASCVCMDVGCIASCPFTTLARFAGAVDWQ